MCNAWLLRLYTRAHTHKLTRTHAHKFLAVTTHTQTNIHTPTHTSTHAHFDLHSNTEKCIYRTCTCCHTHTMSVRVNTHIDWYLSKRATRDTFTMLLGSVAVVCDWLNCVSCELKLHPGIRTNRLKFVQSTAVRESTCICNLTHTSLTRSLIQEMGRGSLWRGEEFLVRSKRLLTDPLITLSLQTKEFTNI